MRGAPAYPVAIGRHLGGNYLVAQPASCFDDQFVDCARHRIDGEKDTGGIRVHHALHDHGHGHRIAGNAVVAPVGHRSIGEQRSPAGLDRLDHGRLANYVEECILLPGEGGLGKVLRSGGRAHGHTTGAQTLVGRYDGAAQLFIHAAAECLGGNAESLGYRQARGQHDSQLRAFTAAQRKVADAYFRERNDKLFHPQARLHVREPRIPARGSKCNQPMAATRLGGLSIRGISRLAKV